MHSLPPATSANSQLQIKLIIHAMSVANNFNLQHTSSTFRKFAVVLFYIVVIKGLVYYNSVYSKRYIYIAVLTVEYCSHIFQQGVDFAHMWWIFLVTLPLLVYLLWSEIGPSCLVGLGLVFVQPPLQYILGRLYTKLWYVEVNISVIIYLLYSVTG